ncbi:MAG: carboxypeptidase regulatory-like domain-containing protein [Acidobacteria bacterium]|nr:carboxypeptidase regulatory-like domain-containing protein [Acidobacteriota bacterium]
MSKYAFRRGCAAVLLLLMAFVMAGAQESRGSLTGTVTDPNGAALPGATVEIRNVETNVANTVTTNEEGAYSFPLLNPGRYTLTVTAQGFSNTTRENIEIRVSEKITLDVPVSVTGVGETVTTIASAPVLETGSVSTGTTVTTRQIAELPLIDGSPYQLATLAPGISYTGNPSVGYSPTSNGNLAAFRANGATGPNQVTLDGAPNFAIDGGVGFSPPSEATQEFKVQTNSFDATQGYTAGATVNTAIKSGTNDLHGSAYYFNRDRNRTANNFFSNRAGQDRPERTYHRFGGTLGGPVRLPGVYNGRDRTFFFAAYERLKDNQAEPQLFTVPTAAFRNGDFSALLNQTLPIRIYDPATSCHTPSNCTVTRTAFAGNVIPTARLNPVAVAYLNLYPLPNVAGNSDGTNNYFSNQIRHSNYRSWLARIDHRINDTNSLFGKYYHSFNPEDRYNWTASPLTQGFEYRTNDGASLDWTSTLSNSMVLDVRTSLSRFVQQRQPAQTIDLASLGFSQAALASMNGYQYLPRFDIRTFDAQRPVRSTLGSNRSDYNAGLLRPFYTFAAQPSLTQIHGDHTMRYGYDYRVLRENFSSNGYQGGRYFFDGTYTSIDTTTTTNSNNQTNANRNRNAYGRDLAAFLLGIPSASTSQSIIDTTGINYSAQSQYHGFYFQDDWRVTPKLTLNLGLRYELELGLTERYNRFIRGFDPNTASPINDAAVAAYTTAYNANPSNFLIAPSQFRVAGGPLYADDNNRALWDADKSNWQPRLGAAYQLNEKTVLRGGFGIFMSPYRIVPGDFLQTGFNAQTPFIPTNDQGRNFVATLNNPFPNGLQTAFGSTRGLLTSVGGDLGASDAGLVPVDRKNAKFSRLIIGFQRELPGQFVVEANFVSSWGRDMAVNRNLNFVPRQFLADLSGVQTLAEATAADAAANSNLSATITNPFRNLGALTANGSPFATATTISRAQSTLAFPQFTNVWVQQYNGSNRYNALQLQGMKRFSRDLSLNVTYTYSKLREKLSYLNPSDTSLEDRIGTDDRPHRFTLATVYGLPLGRGRAFGREMPKVLDAFVGGWQLNGTYEWQSGQPILLSQAFFYAGDINAVESRAGQGTGDGRKYGIDLPVFVNPDGSAFNTTTILRLSSSSLRTVPTTLDNLRHMPFTSVNLSLTKNFKLGEGRNLQIRGEALNAFNHPYFIDLSADPTNAAFGLYSTQRNNPRDIQIGAKFTF